VSRPLCAARCARGGLEADRHPAPGRTAVANASGVSRMSYRSIHDWIRSIFRPSDRSSNHVHRPTPYIRMRPAGPAEGESIRDVVGRIRYCGLRPRSLRPLARRLAKDRAPGTGIWMLDVSSQRAVLELLFRYIQRAWWTSCAAPVTRWRPRGRRPVRNGSVCSGAAQTFSADRRRWGTRFHLSGAPFRLRSRATPRARHIAAHARNSGFRPADRAPRSSRSGAALFPTSCSAIRTSGWPSMGRPGGNSDAVSLTAREFGAGGAAGVGDLPGCGRHLHVERAAARGRLSRTSTCRRAAISLRCMRARTST